MLVPVHGNHCGSIPESFGDAATGEEIEFFAVRAVSFCPERCQEVERWVEGGEGERGVCILPLPFILNYLDFHHGTVRSRLTQDN